MTGSAQLAALAPPLAWFATAALATVAPGRTALGRDLLGLAFRARDLLACRLVHNLHRQPDLAAVVETEELDIDLLTLLHDLADRLGPSLGELGDVHEAVLLAEEVNEGAELHDLHDLALVDLADLGLGRD